MMSSETSVSQESLKVGDVVTLVGLCRREVLNGRHGKVLADQAWTHLARSRSGDPPTVAPLAEVGNRGELFSQSQSHVGYF